MRSRRNHLDALKSRPNRKHLPHWSIDWWINISKSKQKKEVEYSISNSTWVSMPKRVYWGTSRRRSVTPCFTSSNAVFGSILREKNFKLLFLFLFWKFCGFPLLFGVWETSRSLSRARDTQRENEKWIFRLVHFKG